MINPSPGCAAIHMEHLKSLIADAIALHGNQADLNHIDVSGINDSSETFMHFREFNGDISRWDVSNATRMNSKFSGDISKWVIHGINADAMFDAVPLEPVMATDNNHLQALIRQALHVNGDASSLNHIDVSGITDFSDVFAESPTFNGDISGWNVSNVTDMSDMFAHSRFNGDVSSWDVRRVVDFSGIFLKSKFNGDLSRWQVSKDAKCQNTISADRLSAMPKPVFSLGARSTNFLGHAVGMERAFLRHAKNGQNVGHVPSRGGRVHSGAMALGAAAQVRSGGAAGVGALVKTGHSTQAFARQRPTLVSARAHRFFHGRICLGAQRHSVLK